MESTLAQPKAVVARCQSVWWDGSARWGEVGVGSEKTYDGVGVVHAEVQSDDTVLVGFVQNLERNLVRVHRAGWLMLLKS